MAQDQDNTDAVYARGKGCMVCSKKKKLRAFEQDNLKPGDHIQMRGASPCFGRLYHHHAIVSDVSDVSDDRKKANVKVVDVPTAGGIRKTLALAEHNLMDEDEIKCTNLKRVDYRKRRHDHGVTLNRARKYKEVMSSDEGDGEEDDVCCQYFMCFCGCCWSDRPRYCICLRNCEHFATTSVNGRSEINPQEVNNSFCSQAVSCGWRMFHVFVCALQAFFYAINFYIYALFVANDESFNHFTNETKEWLQEKCHHPDNQHHGMHTRCDWYILAVFVAVFTFLFIILFLRQVCLYCRDKIICKQCLLTSGLIMLFKVVLFILFNIINIFIEKDLYELIAGWNTHMVVTIIVIIAIAVVEGVFIYLLSHFCTKLTLWVLANWCCGCCCCKIEKDAHTYVMSYVP